MSMVAHICGCAGLGADGSPRQVFVSSWSRSATLWPQRQWTQEPVAACGSCTRLQDVEPTDQQVCAGQPEPSQYDQHSCCNLYMHVPAVHTVGNAYVDAQGNSSVYVLVCVCGLGYLMLRPSRWTSKMC
jgi:hypothetical protein